jgi:hypothetical protein
MNGSTSLFAGKLRRYETHDDEVRALRIIKKGIDIITHRAPC